VADLTPARAISLARAHAGLDESVKGRAWRVRRLDRPDEAYYLVVLGEDAAAVAVATVSASTGDVGESARLSGRSQHLEVDASRARSLVGADEAAQAELVWRPGVASRSPLYPLWEVTGPAERIYVDQQGKVWRGSF
jgi:hypothetical protein